MVDHDKFNKLKDAYKKLKIGMAELQLCLDEVSDQLSPIDYSDMYIKRVFTLKEMIKFGNKKYEVFNSSSRHQKNVYIRHSLIYMAKQHGFSYLAMGKAIGQSHATCIHAYKKVEDLLFIKDPDFRRVFTLVADEFNKYLEEKNNELLVTANSGNETISQ